ncbi:MAG: hypothetical protein F4186_05170 [Boseongicola sp. SB0676_bin_33]|uniref:Uncharacterized protein n=1 Tax=Boseongicola sp. SB0664_bin_43 TaxID=2604844 RepID=A0A6B0Y701_9RHOB|nr:hypothetical protein [Boseongicola sp. SB0664_bin_43]MYF88789.1 hypothetical protein [Boseongicola sp. SB0676_bin_33]MYK30586.1 hypothetical protein [Boseongicola sp. SB0670_bin_30]
MTEHDQALADDKMRAEIARLVADSSKLAAETSKFAAETSKLVAETSQFKMSTVLAPALAGAAVVAAVGAIVKLLF